MMMTDVTKRYLVPEGEKGEKLNPLCGLSSLSRVVVRPITQVSSRATVVGPQDAKLRQFQEGARPVLGES